MAQMLASLGDSIEESTHAFLQKREVRTRGIILITSDKGLGGPLNSNLFKLVAEIKTPAKYAVIGRKGAQFIARTKRELLADFPSNDRVPFAEIKAVSEFMVKQFLDGAVDTVEVFWPRFRNTLIQVPTALTLLPLTNLKSSIEGLGNSKDAAPTPLDTQMLFEPDAKSVLEALLPLYVNRQVYHCALDAKASEHSARMVAMKTAKDNATKLIGDLTLEYNKARQAGITQEILELAAAQFAA
jgi:F-type H+-transporting ATPase subunit gamma